MMLQKLNAAERIGPNVMRHGMKRKNGWGKTMEVNSEYVKAIGLAIKMHENVCKIETDIEELKRLNEASVCSDEDLRKMQKKLIECIEFEANELERSLDSYQNELP